MKIYCKKYIFLSIAMMLISLSSIAQAEEIMTLASIAQGIEIPTPCAVNDGLRLIAHTPTPFNEINSILATCDQKAPHDTQVLLLHGLLARKEGMSTKNYQPAIVWLIKAKKEASVNNIIPSLELAVTYEWAGQLNESKSIYMEVLKQHPETHAAYLGLARIQRAQADISATIQMNQNLIKKNDYKIEVVNGFSGSMKSCAVNKGLELLNEPKPKFSKIKLILEECDQKAPNDVQVLLLHGLLARKEGMSTKQYQSAISWLLKAKQQAALDNQAPALELAVTYMWDMQFNPAKKIYHKLLIRDPELREAWLGLAAISIAEKDIPAALKISQKLLRKNPHDIDALNSLGRANLANKKFLEAEKIFVQVLHIKPNNQDAAIGLAQAKKGAAVLVPIVPKNLPPIPSCSVNEGLELLNQTSPHFLKIKSILAECDEKIPNDVQVLLLHGLLARKEGELNKNYQPAIFWLQKAQIVAAPNNHSPSLELATTYVWAKQPEKAIQIYQGLLAADCDFRAALLGLSSAELAAYHINNAMTLYQKLLKMDPCDTDAWVGLGTVELTNKRFICAKKDFNQALQISPNNMSARAGLETLKDSTRYRVDLLAGVVDAAGLRSYNADVDLFADLNATDQLLVFLTHNSKEIQSGTFFDPTLLPKNSAAIGFQRQIPDQRGWGVGYDYRERTNQPLEHRVLVNTNIYLSTNLKLFAAAREGFPSPWNNQLYSSGLTLFTNLPVNFTFTGFLGEQQFGGQTTAYSLDFSKEFPSRAFYDVGSAYSPTPQPNWEVHGTLVLPISKNQSVEAIYEHYFSNGGITYFNVGWRVYW